MYTALGTFLSLLTDNKYYLLSFIPLISFSITGYLLMHGNAGSIIVNNSNLIINYNNYVDEYKLSNIEDIKLKEKIGNRFRYIDLYIKAKGKAEYDIHSLSAYSSISKIIALTIFINFIKKNKIEVIDTITKSDIENIRKEIMI